MNELILNIKKTRVMSFSTHHYQHPCRPSINYKDLEITYSSEVNILGYLLLKIHIHSLCISLSKVYYMIKYLKEVVNLHVLKTIYFAHFQTCLKFGIML